MNTKHKALLLMCTAFLCVFTISSIHIITFADDSVDNLEQQSDQLQQELDNLNDRFDGLNTRILDLYTQINTSAEELKKAELDLAAAQVNEQIQYDAMKTRIKYIYEAGDTSFLHLLFDAKNMADFLNRAEFISDISKYDRKMLNEFRDAQKTIEVRERGLKEQRDKLEQLSAKLKKEQASLGDLISSKSNELNLTEEALACAREAQNAKPDLPPTPEPERPEPDAVRPAPSAETEDLVLFAAILQCEAGTKDYDALLAVATVIMNRVESSRYPNTLRDVIYQRGQFSPTWNGSLNRVLAKGPASLCYQVAQDALNGSRLASVSHCYSFRASYTGRDGIVVGGNVFF